MSKISPKSYDQARHNGTNTNGQCTYDEILLLLIKENIKINNKITIKFINMFEIILSYRVKNSFWWECSIIMSIIMNIGESFPLVGANMNSLHSLSLHLHSDHRMSSYESHCTEETQPHRISLCSHRQIDVRTWILLSLSRSYTLSRGNLTNSLNVQTLWPSNSRISLNWWKLWEKFMGKRVWHYITVRNPSSNWKTAFTFWYCGYNMYYKTSKIIYSHEGWL